MPTGMLLADAGARNPWVSQGRQLRPRGSPMPLPPPGLSRAPLHPSVLLYFLRGYQPESTMSAKKLLEFAISLARVLHDDR